MLRRSLPVSGPAGWLTNKRAREAVADDDWDSEHSCTQPCSEQEPAAQPEARLPAQERQWVLIRHKVSLQSEHHLLTSS